MITTKFGNVLDATGIIVHGCNCQGVMGSGLAKEVRERFPSAYKRYRDDYEALGYLPLGKISFIHVGDGKIIVNALTQEHYGRNPDHVYVSYDAIRTCFRLINQLAMVEQTPVNFPMIGAGLANGNWDIISEIIDDELDDRLDKIYWKY